MSQDIRESSLGNFKIAVCIPTRDRSDRLSNCLRSIQASTTAPSLIVVSDDSMSDMQKRETLRVASEYGAIYVSGPRRGVCANRNSCLKEVGDATHVLFLDDDLIISDDFIERAVRRLESLNQNELKRTILSGRLVLAGNIVISDYRMTFRGYYAPSATPEILSHRSSLCPIELFDKAQFNEDIYYGYEDADLSFQMYRYGFSLLRSDELVVEDHGENETVLNRSSKDGVADGDLWAAAAKMHVGLKRYIYYRFRPHLAFAFFIYVNMYLIKTAFTLRSFVYIVTVYRRARLNHLLKSPSVRCTCLTDQAAKPIKSITV